MSFQKNIPIQIIGPTYQDRSIPLSSQETKNFYHDLIEEGKDQFVVHSFPGLKSLSSVGLGADRGMNRMGEVGFRVAGNRLYSFDKDGTHTQLGIIPGGKRCVIDNDGFNLIIVADNVVFQWDGTSLTTITDTNIAGSQAVTYLNSQMIYTKPNLFTIADPDVPSSASGLNSASADSKPDELVIAYAFQQSAYMMGIRSVEPWWNSGEGNPPLQRIDGQIFQVGCAAIHSVAANDDFLYWLGDDFSIYQATGGSKNRISSSAISNDIESYEVINDAIGQVFTFQGENFYMLSFPTAGRTWCLSERLGDKGWFNLSSGLQDAKWQGSSILSVYDKLFVADAVNGSLYELDINTFKNNGETIQRRRVTSSINGKVLGKPGAEVQMSKMKFIMSSKGLISGQGENPQIQFELSFDGGHSWDPQGWGYVGRLGENKISVEMFCIDRCVFYDCMVRLTTSDPIDYSIYSASADLKLTGRST